MAGLIPSGLDTTAVNALIDATAPAIALSNDATSATARTNNTAALRAAFESTTIRDWRFSTENKDILFNGTLFIRDSIELDGRNNKLWYDTTIGGTCLATPPTVTDDGTGDLLVTFAQNHNLSDNDRVAVCTNTDRSSLLALELTAYRGVVPGNLTYNRWYYAIVVSTTTIKLSLTSSGAAIAYSSGGTGNMTFFAPQKQALWVDPGYTLGTSATFFNTNPYNDNANRWDYHIDVTAIDNTQSQLEDTATSVPVTALTVATSAVTNMKVNDIVRLSAYNFVKTGVIQGTTATISSVDTSTNRLTATAHGCSTGDPVGYYTTNPLAMIAATPALRQVDEIYFIRKIDNNTVEFYDTLANANASPATTGIVDFTGGIVTGTHKILRSNYRNGEGGMRVRKIRDNGDGTTTIFINRITQYLTKGLKLSKWKEKKYGIKNLTFKYLKYQSNAMTYGGYPNAPGSLAIQAVVFYGCKNIYPDKLISQDPPSIHFDIICPYNGAGEFTAINGNDQSSTPFPSGGYFDALAGTPVVDYDGAQPGGSGDNTITMSSPHGLDQQTDATVQIRLSSTGTYPGGLAAPSNSQPVYYAGAITATSFKLATTHNNAVAGVFINITSAGTGTLTIAAAMFPAEGVPYGLALKSAVKCDFTIVGEGTRHDNTSNPSYGTPTGTPNCRALYGRNQTGCKVTVRGNGNGKSSGGDTHDSDEYMVIEVHRHSDGGNGFNMRSNGEVHFYGAGCTRVMQATGSLDTPITVNVYGAAINCGEVQAGDYARVILNNFIQIGHPQGATTCAMVIAGGTGNAGQEVIMRGCLQRPGNIAGAVNLAQNGGRLDADNNCVIDPLEPLTETIYAYQYSQATPTSGFLDSPRIRQGNFTSLINLSNSGTTPNIRGKLVGPEGTLRSVVGGTATTGVEIMPASAIGTPKKRNVTAAASILRTDEEIIMRLSAGAAMTLPVPWPDMPRKTFIDAGKNLSSNNATITPSALTTLAYNSGLQTNGGYSADTDWTKGTGWTIAAGVATCDGTNVEASDLTQLSFASFPVVKGRQYSISYVISGTVGTSVQYIFGSILGAAQTTTGTKAATVTALDSGIVTIGLRAAIGFTGSIDNFKVYPATATTTVAGARITGLTSAAVGKFLSISGTDTGTIYICPESGTFSSGENIQWDNTVIMNVTGAPGTSTPNVFGGATDVLATDGIVVGYDWDNANREWVRA